MVKKINYKNLTSIPSRAGTNLLNSKDGNRVFLYDNTDEFFVFTAGYMFLEFDPSHFQFRRDDFFIIYNIDNKSQEIALVGDIIDNTTTIARINSSGSDIDVNWGHIIGDINAQADLKDKLDTGLALAKVYTNEEVSKAVESLTDELEIEKTARAEGDETEIEAREKAIESEAEARTKGDADTLEASKTYTDQQIQDVIENAGTFIGVSFDTYADLEAYVIPDRFHKGDFTFVLTDETHDNATSRYIIELNEASEKVWSFAYVLNQNFTTTQMEAINSGITADILAQLQQEGGDAATKEQLEAEAKIREDADEAEAVLRAQVDATKADLNFAGDTDGYVLGDFVLENVTADTIGLKKTAVSVDKTGTTQEYEIFLKAGENVGFGAVPSQSEISINIDAEVEARKEAVTELTGLLNDEADARQGADKILQDNIDVNTNNIGLLSELKTTDKTNLVNAINEVVDSEVGGEWGKIIGDLADQTDLQEALDTKATASDLESETNLRVGGDNVLTASIEAEAKIRGDADTLLTENLNAEIKDREEADIILKDNIDTKQNTLVSGTNIKTINQQSILGSGDIEVASYLNRDITIDLTATGGAIHDDGGDLTLGTTGKLPYSQGGGTGLKNSFFLTISSTYPVGDIIIPMPGINDFEYSGPRLIEASLYPGRQFNWQNITNIYFYHTPAGQVSFKITQSDAGFLYNLKTGDFIQPVINTEYVIQNTEIYKLNLFFYNTNVSDTYSIFTKNTIYIWKIGNGLFRIRMEFNSNHNYAISNRISVAELT
jgi:hypothetical protein